MYNLRSIFLKTSLERAQNIHNKSYLLILRIIDNI